MDGSLLRKSADAVAIWLVPGNGLAADRQAASEWYRKAAEQGLVQAQRLAFKGARGMDAKRSVNAGAKVQPGRDVGAGRGHRGGQGRVRQVVPKGGRIRPCSLSE